ncbi:hypothetical protein [Hyphomicrobium sp. DY-1]|uniref:hypothetical protein n=1 Tax=Hyphomicrobium sp. DY-1 TaxID=3075650 RepID=UPI0039C118EF
MASQAATHDAIAWAKQRLDELDSVVSEIEKSAESMKGDFRKSADSAIAKLQASRAKLEKTLDDLRAEPDGLKLDAKKVQGVLDAEWVEIEASIQDYLTAVKSQASAVQGVLVARAAAQHQAWEATLQSLRAQASAIVEKATGELEIAIQRLTQEADKFQSKIGAVKGAGDESWNAVKSGVAEAKLAQDRAIQKIRDAFSKLF